MSGTFEDANCLVTDISNAYRNQMFPDVAFVLSDGVTIQTNRYMLAWRSEFFANSLLGLKEEDGEVVMNCDSKIFKLLLDYIWEGRVDFSNLQLEQLLDLLVYARITCLERLVTNIQEHLVSYILEAGRLDIEEYWTVLEFCSSNDYEEIQTSALNFIDKNFNTMCSSKTIVSKLSSAVIFTLLGNKDRTVKEVDVFNALTLWLENQASPVKESTRAALLGMVDLTAMKPADLLRVVRKSGLYTDMDICDAFEKQINLKNEDGVGKPNQTQDGGVRSRSNEVASGMEKFENLTERNVPNMPSSLLGSILDSNRVGRDGGENESRSVDDNIDYNYDNKPRLKRLASEDYKSQDEDLDTTDKDLDEKASPRREHRLERLASEDYKSQDEDLDTTDKDLDEKASPRRKSSLVNWWRSRDSLLSPKAL